MAVLLGLNGLRVSEACATDVEDLATERGDRTLRIMGKDAKPAVRDAVVCHFAENERPKVVRLHLVRDELLAV